MRLLWTSNIHILMNSKHRPSQAQELLKPLPTTRTSKQWISLSFISLLLSCVLPTTTSRNKRIHNQFRFSLLSLSSSLLSNERLRQIKKDGRGGGGNKCIIYVEGVCQFAIDAKRIFMMFVCFCRWSTLWASTGGRTYRISLEIREGGADNKRLSQVKIDFWSRAIVDSKMLAETLLLTWAKDSMELLQEQHRSS